MKLKQAIIESISSLAWWRDMLAIFIGSLFVSAGFVLFINPYNFVPGGVYGLGIVLHNLFPAVQVGTFGYMFDIPLLISGMIIFGRQFGGRTLFANEPANPANL